MRVAYALDFGDEATERVIVRLATALGKYWICKRTPQHVNEAQECLGGLGYIEEHVMSRLYREAPVNSIWEGSGNVQCIDLLRALGRSPETVDVLIDELALAMGSFASFDAAVTTLATDLRQTAPEADPFGARLPAERKLWGWVSDSANAPNEVVNEARELRHAIQNKVKKAKLWAPHLPREFGGMGLSFMQHAYMNEVLAYSPGAASLFGVVAPNS